MGHAHKNSNAARRHDKAGKTPAIPAPEEVAEAKDPETTTLLESAKQQVERGVEAARTAIEDAGRKASAAAVEAKNTAAEKVHDAQVEVQKRVGKNLESAARVLDEAGKKLATAS